MKEFYWDVLEKYLKKADAHDNPKTLKMYEVNKPNTNCIKVLAVTYLRTCLIGIDKTFTTKEDADAFIKTLEEHDHDRGVMLEVGRLT